MKLVDAYPGWKTIQPNDKKQSTPPENVATVSDTPVSDKVKIHDYKEWKDIVPEKLMETQEFLNLILFISMSIFFLYSVDVLFVV